MLVDDWSTDGSAAAMDALAARLPWVSVSRTPRAPDRAVPDRLAAGRAAQAFAAGLDAAGWQTFEHIAKVDADVELPPDFFERLLEEFAADDGLGMAGGVMVERRAGAWRCVASPATHAAPPARVYSRACLEAVGASPSRLGWDSVDETRARLLGYGTRAFADLRVRHHRAAGTADGALRGRARHGRCAYIAQQPLPWVVARAVKVGVTFHPLGIGALAFLWGYARARYEGVHDPDAARLREFTRGELRRRALPSLPER